MSIVEQPDGKPRNSCHVFMLKTEGVGDPVLVTRAEFDALALAGNFALGPFRDGFGDGYGEPYNPYRQVYGKLKDGRLVYAELTEAR